MNLLIRWHLNDITHSVYESVTPSLRSAFELTLREIILVTQIALRRIFGEQNAIKLSSSNDNQLHERRFHHPIIAFLHDFHLLPTHPVATSTWSAFLKLLFRWRGSVYKLIWKDLLVFTTLYYAIHLVYMYGLSEAHQRKFEEVVAYTSHYANFVPLSFVLGFFVSNVMSRWWNQYKSIPWATGIAVYVSSQLHGYDDVGRAMRRTIMRYVCLSLTMVFRVLSPRVQKRFPKMSDLVDAGLLTESELDIIEDLDKKHPGCSKNFLPIVWASAIVTRARSERRIDNSEAANTIIEMLNKFRGQCSFLMTYQTVSIPLVYTQVVTIAVYTYFMNALIAQQYVEGRKGDDGGFDISMIPVFTLLQFIFYMGWLKVAEQLMNPFGEDDDVSFFCLSVLPSVKQSTFPLSTGL